MPEPGPESSLEKTQLACLLAYLFFVFFNLDGVFHFIKETLMFSSSISCFDAFVWYVSEGGKLFLAHTNEKPSFDTCGFTVKYDPSLGETCNVDKCTWNKVRFTQKQNKSRIDITGKDNGYNTQETCCPKITYLNDLRTVE